MKRRGAVVTIPVAPYNVRIHLFTDREQFAADINGVRGGDDFTADDCNGMTWVTKRHFDDIWVGVFAKGALRLSTLAHELIHAMEWIIDRHDLPHGFNNSEPKAYLYQYMFVECSKALRK